MIEELKRNIDVEIEMLREISNYSRRLTVAPPAEQRLIENVLASLQNSLKIINQSIPSLLSGIGPQPLTKPISIPLEKVTFRKADTPLISTVVVQRSTRDKLLNELSISEGVIKKLKRKHRFEKESYEEFKGARGYFRIANKMFQQTAVKWIKKGYFQGLSIEIKKANIEILFETYVSMIFLTTFIAIFFSLFLTVFLLFFSVSLISPYLGLYTGEYLVRLSHIIWIPFVVPVATFFAIYFYPSTEKSSLAKRIDQELPFAVIHMSAISGSGIEPTEIFKIIGLNREYPYLRREIRKVLNQINLYGYDLVTALNNVAKATPSAKLAEVFSGLGTTIHSGGSLGEYFERRSETLLNEYRVDREKFTKIAETFMDIYISAVIAAPMILMLLLVMIGVSGINIGFSPLQMTALIIVIIALINILFIGFLQIKQPTY
ncbi:type II secretion system F family protein [Candidatus Pacearchaeota archaeon]|nr:type II secretion system F family protein [Candidatus Pacearchaeota archaeon]